MNGPENDNWSPGTALLRAVIYAVAAGLAMGLVYFLLIWFLQDWIRSTDFHRTYFGKYYTPLVLLPFFVASAVFAWANLRLAERVSGAYGFLLMIPVTAAAVAAMGVAVGLSRATIAPWSDRFWWVLFALGVGMLAGPAIKRLRSG